MLLTVESERMIFEYSRSDENAISFMRNDE